MSSSSLALRYVLPYHSRACCRGSTVPESVSSLLDASSTSVITWETPSEFLKAVRENMPVDSGKPNGVLEGKEERLAFHLLPGEVVAGATGDSEPGTHILQLTADWVLALPCASGGGENRTELHVLKINRLDFFIQAWSAVTSHVVRLTTWLGVEISFFPSDLPNEILSGMMSDNAQNYYEVRARIPIRLSSAHMLDVTKDRESEDRGAVSDVVGNSIGARRMSTQQLRALIHDVVLSCVSSYSTGVGVFGEAPSAGGHVGAASPAASIKEEEVARSANTNREGGDGSGGGPKARGPQAILPHVFHSIPLPPVPVVLSVCLSSDNRSDEPCADVDDRKESGVVLVVSTLLRAARPRARLSSRWNSRRAAVDTFMNLFPEHFAPDSTKEVSVAEVSGTDLSCVWTSFSSALEGGGSSVGSVGRSLSTREQQDSEASAQASPRCSVSRRQHNPYDRSSVDQMCVGPSLEVPPVVRADSKWGCGTYYNDGGAGGSPAVFPFFCGPYRCLPWTPGFAIRGNRQGSSEVVESSGSREGVRSSWTGLSSWQHVTPGFSCSWTGGASGSSRGGMLGARRGETLGIQGEVANEPLRRGAPEAPSSSWLQGVSDVAATKPMTVGEAKEVGVLPKDDSEVLDLSDGRQTILECADRISSGRQMLLDLTEQVERLNEQFLNISLQQATATDIAEKRRKNRSGRNGQKTTEAWMPEGDHDLVHLVEGLIGTSLKPQESILAAVSRGTARVSGAAEQLGEKYESAEQCLNAVFTMIQELDQVLRATVVDYQCIRKDARKAASGFVSLKSDRKAKPEVPSLFYSAIKALSPGQGQRMGSFVIGASGGGARSGDTLTLLRLRKHDIKDAEQKVAMTCDELRAAAAWYSGQVDHMQLTMRLYKEILVPCLDTRVSTKRDEVRRRSRLIVDWAVSAPVGVDGQKNTSGQSRGTTGLAEKEQIPRKERRNATHPEKSLGTSNNKPLVNGGNNCKVPNAQASAPKACVVTGKHQGTEIETGAEHPTRSVCHFKPDRPARADLTVISVTDPVTESRRPNSPKKRRKAPVVVAQPWSLMTVTPAPVVTTQRRSGPWRRWLCRLLRVLRLERLRHNVRISVFLLIIAALLSWVILVPQ